MRYMAKSSHADGTCDDYFPFERAMGALVFSLYSASETYQVLGMEDDQVLDLFIRRVHHLEAENETGRLSNHQACRTGSLQHLQDHRRRSRTPDRRGPRRDDAVLAEPGRRLVPRIRRRRPRLPHLHHRLPRQAQAEDGHSEKPDDSFLKPLVKAAEFSWHFMHPDGSYGGEHGSRNTYHFTPASNCSRPL